MKKYIRSAENPFHTSAMHYEYCKQEAMKLSDAIWNFQQDISGDPIYSDSLSIEDIETLDNARTILIEYARGTE